MKRKQTPNIQMHAAEQFCSNVHCPKRGLIGQGNIRLHSRMEGRFRCTECQRTFSVTTGTPFFGLKKETELYQSVITLLTWGCPIQAIVQTFDLDERTVAAWRDKAGKHCQTIHHAKIVQGHLDLQQIQADEIRVKGRAWVGWLAMAMLVSTRLWLGGVVSPKRDKHLIRELMTLVAACSHLFAIVLVVTDGFAAYPQATIAAFRSKLPRPKGQRGRSRLATWPGLMLGQVVKHARAKRVVEVTRHILRGAVDEVAECIALSANGGKQELNTSYIERLNATFRQRLGILCRRSRQAAHKLEKVQWAMWLCGTSYNFCQVHHSLRRLSWRGGSKRWAEFTPAMASGLTDHLWSVGELLWYRVPPAPYIAPKKRGRPPKSKSSVVKEHHAMV